MMKHSLRVLATLLIVLVFSTGCGAGAGVDLSKLEKAEHSGQTEEAQVSLVMDYPEYAAGDTEIYWILENATDKTLYWGIPQFEYRSDDTWYTVPIKAGTAFTMSQPFLPAGRRTSGKADTEIRDFSFPTGHYRLVVPFWYDESKTAESADHIAVAEFDIVKKAKRVEYVQFVEQLYDQEAGLDTGLVYIRDTIEGQEVIDRFLDRSLCGVPAEMRLIDPAEDIIQHFYYQNGCWTVQEYKDRAVTTHCYSFLYVDPDIEEVYLSNFLDIQEAEDQGFLVSDPEDVFQLGPAAEAVTEEIRKTTEWNRETGSVIMKAFLYGDVASIGLYRMEDGIAVGYDYNGSGQILESFAMDGLHPIGVRAVLETTGLVTFASPDGQTDRRILDVTTGQWVE